MLSIAAEKTFENKVKDYLKSQGCYYIKTHGDRFSKVGTPDLLINCNGFFLGVELKSATGRPTELQLYHIRCINDSGGIGMVLYPKDFEDFKKLIEFLKGYEPIGKDVVFNVGHRD